jgi:uncharacterized glyoxalase superfamily protein PhnB
MQAKASLSTFTFNHPTPELPVRDAKRAQAYYRDKLGFKVGWLQPGAEAGLQASGATITEPLQQKPWGLTQFTLEDLDGNRFFFHRD